MASSRFGLYAPFPTWSPFQTSEMLFLFPIIRHRIQMLMSISIPSTTRFLAVPYSTAGPSSHYISFKFIGCWLSAIESFVLSRVSLVGTSIDAARVLIIDATYDLIIHGGSHFPAEAPTCMRSRMLCSLQTAGAVLLADTSLNATQPPHAPKFTVSYTSGDR